MTSITPCQIIRTALRDTQMNYARYGALNAVRSKRHQLRIDEMNPALSCNKGRYGMQGGLPTMQFEFDPKYSQGTAGNFIDCAVGQSALAPRTGLFQLNKIKQLPVRITAAEWRQLCCGADAFFANDNAARLKIKTNNEIYAKLSELGVVGQIHRVFNKRIESDFLDPIELDIVSTLVAGVGTSPTTGSNAPINIQSINPATGAPTAQLMSLLNRITQQVNVCQGKWIILSGTGQNAVDFFDRCGISCCNTGAGIDSAALLEKTSQMFDWYTSTQINNVLGPNRAILIAPNSVAGIFGHNHEEMTGVGSWGTMSYGELEMTNMYCGDDPSCVNKPGFNSISLGLRVKEIDCPTAEINAWLDTRYGVWTQPQNFSYLTAPLNTYTGLVGLNFI